MIYSALYYTGSLAKGDLIVRDNRFYPGKYIETLPVWMAYIRKHYPEEHITLFADAASPIPGADAAALLGEHYSIWSESWGGAMSSKDRVHIRILDQFSGQYFRPMQRNLVEAICVAYERNEDLIWIDNDCFLNTDIRPLVAGYEVASSSVAPDQMTMGSVCFYISNARLHALDDVFGPGSLPAYLRSMLANGPTETRMHSLQEGGLYKTFWHGYARDLSGLIDMTHLSCYNHFMAFLRGNPLDTPEYRALLAALEGFDMTRLAGVELDFHDDYHTTGSRQP